MIVPSIKRARGYRLYDLKGKRYLDLYQVGGWALLGHRPGRLAALMKNVLSRGLLADLPSVYGNRLEKALACRFPAHPFVRLARSRERAMELASFYLGETLSASKLFDPLLEAADPAASLAGRPAMIWRAFLEADLRKGEPEARVLFPILPFGMSGSPAVVCFQEPLPPSFPVSDWISPMLLAGALRALHDLDRYNHAPWYRPDLLEEAPGWRQQGIYILPTFPKERYPEVFDRFLEEGFLLAPQYPGPSLLPAEASPGELRKMLDLFKAIPGE